MRKMSSSANQPVCVGTSPASSEPRTQRKPRPGRGEQVLDRAARDEVGPERARVELDRADGLVAVGQHERALRVRDLGDRRRRRRGDPCGTRSSRSRRGPCARRSPRRSARAGSMPSASGRTCTTSAPRSACACAIWPTVGNSYSLITMRVRPPRSSGSAETMAFTPCETDVVTAISSVEACSSRANADAGGLGTLDPVLPLGAVRVPAVEVLLVGGAHPMRERALRARVQVGRVREDRELLDAGKRSVGSSSRGHRGSVTPRACRSCARRSARALARPAARRPRRAPRPG